VSASVFSWIVAVSYLECFPLASARIADCYELAFAALGYKLEPIASYCVLCIVYCVLCIVYCVLYILLQSVVSPLDVLWYSMRTRFAVRTANNASASASAFGGLGLGRRPSPSPVVCSRLLRFSHPTGG